LAAASIVVGMKRSAAAIKLLDELDDELASSAKRQGRELEWTAAEREHLAMIAETVDRREMLKAMFARWDTDDRKSIIQLSQEIRLCDAAVSRLLKSVNTDEPPPMSLTSIKARKAALARWDKVRNDATG
jgi:transposase